MMNSVRFPLLSTSSQSANTPGSGQSPVHIDHQNGLSLIELLITVAIAAFIMAGLAGVVNQTLNTEEVVRQRNELTQQARFAMQRMVVAVSGTRRLLLPLADNPGTDWREHVREQTFPASAPEGSSTQASAVLAVTLDISIDRDRDGWADANNDQDFLDLNNNGLRDVNEPERIDEDLGTDNCNDFAQGIIGIDDDGDGAVDEGAIHVSGTYRDNDEDGTEEEDPINGVDDDADGSIDEDVTGDMNKDGDTGIKGVDDDLDGTVDEGPPTDNDEDGLNGEDWFDAVVFYLSGNKLIERLPSQSDTNGDTFITGADFTESEIAVGVTRFRVERIPQGGGRAVLIDLSLEMTDFRGDTVSLNTRVRVGGGS